MPHHRFSLLGKGGPKQFSEHWPSQCVSHNLAPQFSSTNHINLFLSLTSSVCTNLLNLLLTTIFSLCEFSFLFPPPDHDCWSTSKRPETTCCPPDSKKNTLFGPSVNDKGAVGAISCLGLP